MTGRLVRNTVRTLVLSGMAVIGLAGCGGEEAKKSVAVPKEKYESITKELYKAGVKANLAAVLKREGFSEEQWREANGFYVQPDWFKSEMEKKFKSKTGPAKTQ